MRIKAAACLPCAGGPRARLLGRKLASPPYTAPSRPPDGATRRRPTTPRQRMAAAWGVLLALLAGIVAWGIVLLALWP